MDQIYVKLLAIVGLVVIALGALFYQIDGALLNWCVVGITGIAGYDLAQTYIGSSRQGEGEGAPGERERENADST